MTHHCTRCVLKCALLGTLFISSTSESEIGHSADIDESDAGLTSPLRRCGGASPGFSLRWGDESEYARTRSDAAVADCLTTPAILFFEVFSERRQPEQSGPKKQQGCGFGHGVGRVRDRHVVYSEGLLIRT